jgi:8-oxo-dGTP diphosphatase
MNMEREHRISAGAIVIQKEQILLVRCNDADGKSFLVGPGGGALSDEGINRAVVREVREETGLEVKPGRILFVEDLFDGRYRVTKIWFLCDIIGGQLTRTKGAIEEEITEAGWYRKEQLQNEVVYPSVLMKYEWSAFSGNNWETQYLGLNMMNFDI